MHTASYGLFPLPVRFFFQILIPILSPISSYRKEMGAVPIQIGKKLKIGRSVGTGR